MILLDTHSLLWVLDDNPRIGPVARRVIEASSVAYTSVLTGVELRIKAMKGKHELPANFDDAVRTSGFEVLALEQRHVHGLSSFPTLVKHDPFDRMMVAQAYTDQLNFITADRTLLALNKSWIIDASE